MSCAGSLLGTGCGCGCSGVGSVGAITDAGEFADRVNSEIEILDVDVQGAITSGKTHLHPEFNFNEWNSFVNDDVCDTPQLPDLCDEFPALHPPRGWRQYFRVLGFTDFVMHGDRTISEVSLFELRYKEFRDSFKLAGGRPTGPDPEHPGIPKTPDEEAADAEARQKFIRWGFLIAGVVAVGYAVSSVAPFVPLPKRRRAA